MTPEVKPYVFFKNTTQCLVIITDVLLGGQSMLKAAHENMLAAGRLEDAEDTFTILPGESIGLCGDVIEWLEP